MNVRFSLKRSASVSRENVVCIKTHLRKRRRLIWYERMALMKSTFRNPWPINVGRVVVGCLEMPAARAGSWTGFALPRMSLGPPGPNSGKWVV